LLVWLLRRGLLRGGRLALVLRVSLHGYRRHQKRHQ
jgi:hypothetical protein